MGEWIGTIGGAMMIVLIFALLLQFMSEMGWCPNGLIMRKRMLQIATIGFLELMICGFYYTAKVNGTPILDIGTIWAKQPLIFQEKYPFNWYISMLLGMITYWNFYRILDLFMEPEESENGLYLALAAPGSYLLFLPFRYVVFGFLVTTIARLLLSEITTKQREHFKNILAPVWKRLGGIGYLCVMMILVVANAATVILLLGV